MMPPLDVEDLGMTPYRDAWAHQERVHAEVLAGGRERLLLLEHPPVITTGRRPGQGKNILQTGDALTARGVEMVESDRGGDVTFHGPGQLIAYPILRLVDHGFTVSGYVHFLEDVIATALRTCGIAGEKDPCAIGVWTRDGDELAKIAAIGVRIRRGVTLHGLALNVTTDLNFFDLIVPCGLTGRPVTSMQKLLVEKTPTMHEMKRLLTRRFEESLDAKGRGRSMMSR
jgi:lipoyl(octanoyl) transferase